MVVISGKQSVADDARTNSQWRVHFLDTLAETSNVSAAARKAKINVSRAYKAKREDPDFARKWSAALLEGYGHLEMETLHRLRMGTSADKDEPKFDIANALHLLMHHRETVAHQRAMKSHGDEESILAALNAKIDAMRTREAEVKDLLAQDKHAQNEAQNGHD